MKLEGHVDRFNLFSIHGWAADHENHARTVRIKVVNNGRTVGEVPAAVFRHDLLNFGFGDGKKAFWFNPFECFRYGENVIEVFFADTGRLLHGGSRTFYFDAHQVEKWYAEDPMAASKVRWQGAESDRSLTWGSLMTGDSFFGEVAKHMDLSNLADAKILEVGPGYGRLLSTLRERQLRYKSYVGLELSADRVAQLTAKFGDDRTRFVVGDAMTDIVESDCDLFMCSATFEHLYPNLTQTLLNIGRQLRPDAWLFIDFPQVDPDMLVSSAWFESKETGGAFVRVYSKPELERLFAQCVTPVDWIASITAGIGFGGETIDRILVGARLVPAPAFASGDTAAMTRAEPLHVAMIGTGESAEWPHSDGREAEPRRFSTLRGRGSVAWSRLYRLRHSRRVKPKVDRLATTRLYRIVKDLAMKIMLRHRH